MKVKLAFSQTNDGRFLVLAEFAANARLGLPPRLHLAAFDHEDVFLRLTVVADLNVPDTLSLLTTVILSISQPVFPQRWVEIFLTREQVLLLGLSDDLDDPRPHAPDETDLNLALQVTEHREQQLYSQWVELETIYRTAPVGMALIGARDFKVRRINEKLAELMGVTVEQILGRNAVESSPTTPDLRHLMQSVVDGERVRDITVRRLLSSSESIPRTWLVSISPTLGEAGEVESLFCISVEVPQDAWSERDTQPAAVEAAEWPSPAS